MFIPTSINFRRIDLAWSAGSGNDIAGYNIYRGTSSTFVCLSGPSSPFLLAA